MKLYYYNSDVGSGIERIGNLILGMLEDCGQFKVVEYKNQNPPFILIDELVKEKPDIIVINEFYPRILRAVSYYKSFYPKCKIILINHTLSTLQMLPMPQDYKYRGVDRDGIVHLNHFLRNKINTIINLNWYPNPKPLHQMIQQKVIHKLFPVNYKKFKITKPFKDRKDFCFIGTIAPHKFSTEFIEKIQKTDIKIDMYGSFRGDENHTKLIKTCKNIYYKGYIEEENLVNVMNKYKFFIMPRDGHEPFMLTMAEVIMCGQIPLVANDRKIKGSDWIEHYHDCYLEYQSVDELIKMMLYYLENIKHNSDKIKSLSSRSIENSEEIKTRTNYDDFKKILLNSL